MDITSYKMYFKFTYTIDHYKVKVKVISRSKYQKIPKIGLFLFIFLLFNFIYVKIVSKSAGNIVNSMPLYLKKYLSVKFLDIYRKCDDFISLRCAKGGLKITTCFAVGVL